MNLSEMASCLDIANAHDLPAVTCSGVSIDSRKINPGELFAAIIGEKFDGHDFVASAVAQGAVAVLVSRLIPDIAVPQLVVNDTLQALTRLATYHRTKQSCAVIALTGSNGKTTVKEMIATILPPPALATRGNLNNHIGVPLSVLQLQPEHRYAVFELGANHRGEIATTVAIVQPHVALINNIAPAHIEGFGSIEGVAKAKGEIYQGLALGGTAIVNADDAFADFWAPLLVEQKVLRFSIQQGADFSVKAVTYDARGCAHFILCTPQGEATIQLQVPGQHNMNNAVAAAACTHAVGIPLSTIADGLQQFTGVSGRMTFKQGKNNALIIDDTYNANLRSVLTALDVLARREGERIFVFGDMGELGAWSQQHHEEVGRAARAHGIERLITYGQHSEATAAAFGDTAKHYVDQHLLVQDLLPYLKAGTTILVKGSRRSAMEQVVQQLV